MKKKISTVYAKIYALASSSRGRNALTFGVFLIIAAIFWFILALNDEVQQDFDIPLKLNEVPEGITVISNLPSALSVSVKDKGSSLIKYNMGKHPELELNYSNFKKDSKRLTMTSSQLLGNIRSVFGQNANILEIRPDSLSIVYTNLPGVKKRVNVVSDVTASPQHIISGPIQAVIDTVKVYSVNNIPSYLTVKTDTIIISGLTDTTYVDAELIVPDGMKVVPASVQVMIPVEPLIAKQRQIPIETLNVPDGMRVLTFPSTVEINYTVPISLYNRDDYRVKAYAKYKFNSKKLPLELSGIPDIYQNVYLSTDSVEYLIERK